MEPVSKSGTETARPAPATGSAPVPSSGEFLAIRVAQSAIGWANLLRYVAPERGLASNGFRARRELEP